MDHNTAIANHITRLRRSELEALRGFFQPEIRVLEVGGGNGFQANIIHTYGCYVESIDLQHRDNISKYFKVCDYDGKKIPFESGIFDIVFSSNVLEHVQDLDNILEEIRRVLKSDGKLICILPTPSWRFWTSLSHFIYLVAALLKRLIIKKSGSSEFMRILPPAHGNFKSSFHEIYCYSIYRWRKVFVNNGFEIISRFDTGVFCTGYAIFPIVGINARKKLSAIFGSAGNIFVLNKSVDH
jgi:ubiquinone/menaquinone biosynthesis C-methylase UbiE